MRKTVLIIDGNYQYTKLFADFGWVVSEDSSQLKNVDLVCFTGGEDVTPSYYGESYHPTTYSSIVRDEYEKQLFKLAMENEIPCAGICRGGQFLNVMNGGKMYQNVSDHCMSHDMFIEDDESPHNVVHATSTHHQMMRAGPTAQLLAYAKEGGWKEYMLNNDVVEVNNEELDTEVLFYPNTKCLCFQPHPEFAGCNELKEVFFHFVNKYCK